MSLQQIIDDFQRAAQRCRSTADKIEDFLFATKAQAPEVMAEALMQLGRETDDLLRDLREHVGSNAEAMHHRDDVPPVVRFKCGEIARESKKGLFSREARRELDTRISKEFRLQQLDGNHRVFAAMAPILEALGAMGGLADAAARLPSLADNLADVAGHFRVKYALEPLKETPPQTVNTHHSNISNVNVHGATLGALNVGDGGQLNGTVSFHVDGPKSTSPTSGAGPTAPASPTPTASTPKPPGTRDTEAASSRATTGKGNRPRPREYVTAATKPVQLNESKTTRKPLKTPSGRKGASTANNPKSRSSKPH
jgi:hypothetical protein